MTAQENKEIVRGIFDSVNRRDFDSIAKYFDNNAETTIVPRENIFKGPDGFKQFLKFRMSISSDIMYDVTNIAGCEDTVAAEYNLRGKFDGTYPVPEGEDFHATGKPINLKCCDLITIKDEKIIRWRSYTDLYTIMRQIGIIQEITHH